MYLLSSNTQIRLWHRRLSHASNAKVVQASKLVNGINLREESGFINKSYSSDSKPDNNSDVDAGVLASINKVTEHNSKGMEEFCKAFMKNKHTRIVKSKKMTLMTKRLQKVYVDLLGPHKSASILGKNYVGLIFDKFTRKLWILLLRNKDEFFNTFKRWLQRAEACKSRLDCL